MLELMHKAPGESRGGGGSLNGDLTPFLQGSVPPPAPIPLRAGPLTLLFEQGELLYIRAGQHEIVRRVYGAVRDRNWETVPLAISNLTVRRRPRSFELSFFAEHVLGGVDFCWNGAIRGEENGEILFRMEGRARSDFPRTRIGLCVLHPSRECAGKPCRVERIDASFVDAVFPAEITAASPLPGFRLIRALDYEPRPNLGVEIRFEGEIFETEDQRNWTDASFKTYGTPAELPVPVQVSKGTTISQSVLVRLKGECPGVRAKPKSILVTVDGSPGPTLPQIGLSAASHNEPFNPVEVSRLRALRLGHLRADLRLVEPGWRAPLRATSAAAAALGVPLEMVLFQTGCSHHDVDALFGELSEIRPWIKSWCLPAWDEGVRSRIVEYDRAAKIGGGTDADFFHLQSVSLPLDRVDFVSYPIQPQTHASDNRSLVETLEIQGETAVAARRLFPLKPIVVGPVTLKMRYNPYALAPAPPQVGELPPQVDTRQLSLFGAGWTLGSLKHLSEAGVSAITYYESTGWRGVIELPLGAPLPGKFPSFPGAVFPLYHVLADFNEFQEGAVLFSRSAEPLQVECLTLRKGNRLRIMLANFTPEPRGVRVLAPKFSSALELSSLDETNVAAAMRSPENFRNLRDRLPARRGGVFETELRRYSILRIDGLV